MPVRININPNARAQWINIEQNKSRARPIIVTIDNNIQYVNKAATSLFALTSQEELIGREFTDFIHESSSDVVSCVSLQRIISDDRILPFELRAQRGLMQTQHQFDRILNHSLIGIALVGHDYRVIRCNHLFRKILGLNSGCGNLALLSEPSFFSKIQGRLLPSDSIRFNLSLDFKDMTENGYIESERVDVADLEMLVSPVFLDDEEQGYLVQIAEH